MQQPNPEVCVGVPQCSADAASCLLCQSLSAGTLPSLAHPGSGLRILNVSAGRGSRHCFGVVPQVVVFVSGHNAGAQGMGLWRGRPALGHSQLPLQRCASLLQCSTTVALAVQTAMCRPMRTRTQKPLKRRQPASTASCACGAVCGSRQAAAFPLPHLRLRDMQCPR